jgi:hypothetical protein
VSFVSPLSEIPVRAMRTGSRMIGGYFWLALQGERDARTKFLRERV